MSGSVNKVLLMGHLGSDPEIRYLPVGIPTATLSIATSRRRRRPDGAALDETEWHLVSLFGDLAEVARDRLRKGSLSYIEGHIRAESWRDRDGHDRQRTLIVGNRLKILTDREAKRTADPLGASVLQALPGMTIRLQTSHHQTHTSIRSDGTSAPQAAQETSERPSLTAGE